jgi:hypothetical protein
MKKFYDLTIQIWPEDDEFYYSVIQSFTEEGEGLEVLAYGTEDSEEAALHRVRETVLSVLE